MAKTRSSEEVKALYDAACKKVLSEKGIAAHILKGCMEEYKAVPIEGYRGHKEKEICLTSPLMKITINKFVRKS